MSLSSLEGTDGIVINGPDSSIIGAKRSREDETQETGRNHKAGEDRQPLATTESRQEGTDSAGTNKAPQNQHTQPMIVDTTRTPDLTTSPPGVTTMVSASTVEGSREVNVEERVTVQPAGAHAPAQSLVRGKNEEQAGQWSPVRVKKCQVCGKEDRRYCCPRCGKLTCSLSCCVRHKREEGCTGKRDKVAFVSLKNFTDAHLRSDFNFLEDALRCVDGGKRERSKRSGVIKGWKGGNFNRHRGRGRGRGRLHHGQDTGASSMAGQGSGDDVGAFSLLIGQHQDCLSGRAPRLKRLVKEAALRGTKLLLMPDGMVRHDSNTTTMISGGVRSDSVNDNGKKRQTSESPTSQGIGSAGQKGNGGCIKKGPIGGLPLSAKIDVSGELLEMEAYMKKTISSISWKVEWVFCEASSAKEGSLPDGIHVTDPGVSEGCLLHEALSKHLQLRPGNAPLRHRLRNFVKPWASMSPVERVEALPSDQNASVSGGLRLFLKRVPCFAKTPVYWELDCRETLGEALKGKTVIEFPTIYVALAGLGSIAFRTLVSEVLPVTSVEGSLVDKAEKTPESFHHGEVVSEASTDDDGDASLETDSSEEEQEEDGEMRTMGHQGQPDLLVDETRGVQLAKGHHD